MIERLSILHLLLSMGETTNGYNEHCLALAGRRDLSICTLLRPTVRCSTSIALYAGDGSIPGFFRALSKALHWKYDVVHAHEVNVAFLFLIARLFKPWKAMPPRIFTLHTSYPNLKLRNRLVLIPVFLSFSRVICCSQASYASLPGFYKKLAGNRLRVVQNGVDVERADRVTQSIPQHPSADIFTVIAIGRLIRVKNPLSILRAFESSADGCSRMVFVGEGKLWEELAAIAEGNGLTGKVEFTGLIPREKVYQKLMQADLFVSASFVEGLPVSVLEAMACRRPVILSDIPQHQEIARETDCIPLVLPSDINGFAGEIKRFREMPGAQRAEIGEKCRKVAVERFSLTRMHQDYDAIYDEVRAHSAD